QQTRPNPAGLLRGVRSASGPWEAAPPPRPGALPAPPPRSRTTRLDGRTAVRDGRPAWTG
ncbi:hypothetical protein, partial [Streptomyces olivaceus]|uniref:hypothetical protein n=1 Tax=Streptomyces olivaceus TaxID=47716 RepID=UPI00366272A0